MPTLIPGTNIYAPTPPSAPVDSSAEYRWGGSRFDPSQAYGGSQSSHSAQDIERAAARAGLGAPGEIAVESGPPLAHPSFGPTTGPGVSPGTPIPGGPLELRQGTVSRVEDIPAYQVMSGTGPIGMAAQRTSLAARYAPEELGRAVERGSRPEEVRAAENVAVARRMQEYRTQTFQSSALADLTGYGLISVQAKGGGPLWRETGVGLETAPEMQIVLTEKGQRLGAEKIYELENKAAWGGSFDFILGDNNELMLAPEGTRASLKESGMEKPLFISEGGKTFLVAQKEGKDTIRLQMLDPFSYSVGKSSETPLKDLMPGLKHADMGYSFTVSEEGITATPNFRAYYTLGNVNQPAPQQSQGTGFMAKVNALQQAQPEAPIFVQVLSGEARANLTAQSETALGMAKPRTFFGQKLADLSGEMGKYERWVSGIHTPLGLVEGGLSMGGGVIEAANLPGIVVLGAAQAAEMRLKGIPGSTEEGAAFLSAYGHGVGGFTSLPLTFASAAAWDITAAKLAEGILLGTGERALLLSAPKAAAQVISGTLTSPTLTLALGELTGKKATQAELLESAAGGTIAALAFEGTARYAPRPAFANIVYSVAKEKAPGVESQRSYTGIGVEIPSTGTYPLIGVHAEANRVPGIGIMLGQPRFSPGGVAAYPMPMTPLETAIMKPNLMAAADYLARHSRGFYYLAPSIKSTAEAPWAETYARSRLAEFSLQTQGKPEVVLGFGYPDIPREAGGVLGFRALPARYSAGMKLMDFVYSAKDEAKTPFTVEQVLGRMDLFKKPGAAKLTMDLLKQEEGVIGGSVSQKVAMGEAMIGEPHDIDFTLLKGGAAEKEAAAARIVEAYKPIYGKNVRIGEKSKGLVEIYSEKEGLWRHAWDIHAPEEVPEPGTVSASKQGYFGYGMKSKLPFRTKEGFQLTVLSEQGGRKLSSAMAPREFGFAPEAHRLKDVFHGLQAAEYKAFLLGREDLLKTAAKFRKTIPSHVAEAYEPWITKPPEFGIIISKSRPEIRATAIARASRPSSRTESPLVRSPSPRSPSAPSSPLMSAMRSPSAARSPSAYRSILTSPGSPARPSPPRSPLSSRSGSPSIPGSPSLPGSPSVPRSIPGSPSPPRSPPSLRSILRSVFGSPSPSSRPETSPPPPPNRRIYPEPKPAAAPMLSRLLRSDRKRATSGERYIYVDLLSASRSFSKYGQITSPSLKKHPELWATEGGLTPSLEQIERRQVKASPLSRLLQFNRKPKWGI